MSWRLQGTYFESCNCDAICPCRRIDGVPGGRSTHGVCMGVLSWLIEEGRADGTDLSGLAVALACRYDDDEPGSPWTWTLYLDERASTEHARGHLHGPSRRGHETPLPVGMEAERACRSATCRDRGRPHTASPAPADTRPCQRPDPRSLRRRRDGHLRDPRARPARRGTYCGRARRRGWATRLPLPRCLRIRLNIRLFGLALDVASHPPSPPNAAPHPDAPPARRRTWCSPSMRTSTSGTAAHAHYGQRHEHLRRRSLRAPHGRSARAPDVHARTHSRNR
jgi:hypothetical protein